MLIRGPELGGSAILRRELKALKHIEVIPNTVVSEITSEDGWVTGVQATTNGQPVNYRASGIFVLIGLIPTTTPFKGSLDLDEAGFIVTDPKLATSIPGVFAAGDVRSGSTWQIASAVGEGASAALSVREYLVQQRRR